MLELPTVTGVGVVMVAGWSTLGVARLLVVVAETGMAPGVLLPGVDTYIKQNWETCKYLTLKSYVVTSNFFFKLRY